MISIILTTIVCCTPPSIDTTPLLDAMYQVESSGGKNLVGDFGMAIGPYQIHWTYWKDATVYDPTIKGKYEDCNNKEYSERIIKAYWARYAPKNATVEQLARIHNGGGGILVKQFGISKSAMNAWKNTTAYWNKIKMEMEIKFYPAL